MQFLGAEVMRVSAVPCSGRAVVLLVSSSPCLCVLGEFFAEAPLEGLCRASFFAPTDPAGLGCSAAHEAGCGGGFALHEALWLRVAGVLGPHVVQFPPVL